MAFLSSPALTADSTPQDIANTLARQSTRSDYTFAELQAPMILDYLKKKEKKIVISLVVKKAMAIYQAAR